MTQERSTLPLSHCAPINIVLMARVASRQTVQHFSFLKCHLKFNADDIFLDKQSFFVVDAEKNCLISLVEK